MGSMNANLFLVQIHFIQTFYEDIFFLGYSRIKKKKNYSKNIERKYQISRASKSQNITIPYEKYFYPFNKNFNLELS